MLAESWKAVSETVWEFKLRPGVKWHDGRDFTADDVAFTVARVPDVPNSPATFAGFVRAIRRVEVVDPLTVRFHTAARESASDGPGSPGPRQARASTHRAR